MTRPHIPKKVAFDLWWRAAGRCEFKGCNKPLYRNGLTMDPCNISNFAHIIADSPRGPRGSSSSKTLSKKVENIMLMCPECHRYIDHEGKEKNSPDVLYAMKKRHEDRMRRLTGMGEDLQAHIVTYGAPIGDIIPEFSFPQLQAALLPDFYPANDDFIDLSSGAQRDKNWTEMWKRDAENVEYHCKEKILDRMGRWDNKRVALFGFAPMPLLVKLGTILNRKYDVVVYQNHRGYGWGWPSSDGHVDYIVNRPTEFGHEPVLVLSLSFSIIERVRCTRPSASIWEMTIPTPDTNFLRSRTMLCDFGNEAERLLDEISKSVGGYESLDVYMAVPVACAIEIGRVWTQKQNMPMNLYEYDARYSEVDRMALKIK